MLSYEVRAAVAAIRYKPGTKITLLWDGMRGDSEERPFDPRVKLPDSDSIAICIEIDVIDADDPQLERRTTIKTEFAISGVLTPFYSISMLINRIFDEVQQLEMHESAEFFRVHGERWLDPHAPRSTRERRGL